LTKFFFLLEGSGIIETKKKLKKKKKNQVLQNIRTFPKNNIINVEGSAKDR
jgi:hypothetical protein